MSNGIDWHDLNKKVDAILRVMRHIVNHPAAGQNCVGNDAAARALFEDPNIGNISIPSGSRVVMFAAGEEALKEKGSLIIELPDASSPNPSDETLIAKVLGNYKYWKPAP
jgi:hypothetical protein